MVLTVVCVDVWRGIAYLIFFAFEFQFLGKRIFSDDF